MPLWEKWVFTLVELSPQRQRALLASKLKATLKQYPQWNPKRIEQRYRNILEVFEQDNPLHD